MSGDGSDFQGLSGAPPSTVGDESSRRAPDVRRERARLIAASILAAVIAVFAVLNLGDVKVHWLVTSGHTPLIVVIAFAFILGVLVDRLVMRARRKRRA